MDQQMKFNSKDIAAAQWLGLSLTEYLKKRDTPDEEPENMKVIQGGVSQAVYDKLLKAHGNMNNAIKALTAPLERPSVRVKRNLVVEHIVKLIREHFDTSDQFTSFADFSSAIAKLCPSSPSDRQLSEALDITGFNRVSVRNFGKVEKCMYIEQKGKVKIVPAKADLPKRVLDFMIDKLGNNEDILIHVIEQLPEKKTAPVGDHKFTAHIGKPKFMILMHTYGSIANAIYSLYVSMQPQAPATEPKDQPTIDQILADLLAETPGVQLPLY